MQQADRQYADMRVRRYTREAQRLALKMGLVLASFIGIAFALELFVPTNPIAILAMAVIASGLVVFGTWTIGWTTVLNTMEFVRELNQEYQEAIARD